MKHRSISEAGYDLTRWADVNQDWVGAQESSENFRVRAGNQLAVFTFHRHEELHQTRIASAWDSPIRLHHGNAALP